VKLRSNGFGERALTPALELVFTVLGFLVMGYHPGLEDDGIYLSAVKFAVDPRLYPFDADYFRRQLQASMFDRFMAAWVHITHMPVAWTELFWQFASLLVLLWAAHAIARRLFPEARAQWAGVGLLAAMWTLPVAGVAVNVADQHLHPRNMATAIILIAVERVLARRPQVAFPLALLAFVIHPIMAAFGASFCVFLTLAMTDRVALWLRRLAGDDSPVERASLRAALPLGWLFEPPSPTWRRALVSRRYYFLSQWTWYEWLGAIGPLVLFWVLWRIASRRRDSPLARFALAVFAYGVFQQALAMLMLGPAALVRLTPLQPMRYLQLIYIFLLLIGGCLLGRHLLGRSVLRWGVFLVAVNAGMFAAQRISYPNSQHLEWPGRSPSNPWLQAFAWIRQNTPVTAYFALDPHYLETPGEDYHSFRALAERSQLADAIKDTAVVTQVPDLGPRWAREVDAQANWKRFGVADFQMLKSQFGVDWVLVPYPAPAGLPCAWHNYLLSVCSIPGPAIATPPENAANHSFLLTWEVSPRRIITRTPRVFELKKTR
jgi:hypothetical protein